MEKRTLYKTGLHGRGENKLLYTDKNYKTMRNTWNNEHCTKQLYMDEERLS
jgi:hypothetical protein